MIIFHIQHTKTIPPEELIVEISMEKGGTSVLADGYLVEGDMTEEGIPSHSTLIPFSFLFFTNYTPTFLDIRSFNIDALFAFGLGVVRVQHILPPPSFLPLMHY